MRTVLELPRPEASAQSPRDQLALSVVVPVSERPSNLVALYQEYSAALRQLEGDVEFIYVLEPHFRRAAEALARAMGEGEPVRVLIAGQTLGDAALVKMALPYCRGRNILTLPPYHRVAAEVLPRLIDKVEAGADMAIARRWPRRDPWINRLQHRMLHLLIGGLGGGTIRDVACGVRVMRKDVLESVPLYGDHYRFLPLIAYREGFRVEELDAQQHPKDVRTRVYSPGFYLRRLLDLLGLFFLLRFTDKPLRFFGLSGSICSLLGLGLLAMLLLQRLGGEGIADRPLLVLGVMLVVLGVQAIALGLIGEIIVHLGASGRRPYRLARPELPES